jgi:parallel beta-helix repeat protein
VQKTENRIDFKAWGDTHTGKRENNEDRILCEPDRGIFVVVDGMGGEAAGEVAAQHAVDAIAARLHQETGSVERRLGEAIAGANNEIYRLAELNPTWKGMACVLTAAIIENGMLYIGHVGDSRLYRIHQGQIRKLTPDHSPIGQREDAGGISETEAMRHPRRNEVFRDVGSQLHKPDDADFIEHIQTPFDNDTALIICSDGLSDMLASREILQTVLDCAGSPRDCVRKLIEKANDAGGKDNISAIVVEGENFAASCKIHKQSSKKAGNLQFSYLWSRWAFLFYGLAAGLLAGFLWNGSNSVEEKSQLAEPARLPAVLVVEPSSPEYPNIAKAMESAQPGDRIEIGDGEYQEAIKLKEGVEVAARVPGKAVLRLAQIIPGTDAAISADGIKKASVSGLAIKAAPGAGLPYGIRSSNSDVNFSNIEITGANTAGILVDGSSSGVIAANYIHRNIGPGILVAGEANPLLVGNLVYANGVSRNKKNAAPGLCITGRSDPEVKRNVFSGNGAEAIRLQRQELKSRMMDNLFVGSVRPARAVVVEPH